MISGPSSPTGKNNPYFFLVSFLKNTSGFTMVEMVVATTIFAMMGVMIMSLYLQTTNLGQKMRVMRHLSESAREITERIAEDVRDHGIATDRLSDGTSYIYWNTPNVTESGSEILAVGDGNKKYIYGRKIVSAGVTTLGHCDDTEKRDPKIHCGLYVVTGDDYAHAYNLVDSFVPEEEKKRVKIEDMKFFVSGDGTMTEKKVTLVFTLALMPRISVPYNLIQESRIHIQTTLSERFFRK